jgi:hypothetical protein
MKKENQVLPEDFNILELWIAACEGRLYLEPRKVGRTQIRKDVLLYADLTDLNQHGHTKILKLADFKATMLK